MSALLLLVLSFVSAKPQNAYNSIRGVDFKNFTFCWDQDDTWPSKLKWLDPSDCKPVALINGRWREPVLDDEPRQESSFPRPFAGLILEEVQYVRLKPATEQAVIVLRRNSGGTQYSHYVFVYALERGQPALMAAAHSGDRSYFGLSRVFVERHQLILELFDPEKRVGDCCSEGVVRHKYLWRKGGFSEVGTPVYDKALNVSRIPVDMFGQHP